MARISRIVGIGLPHHITQRGNRRQQTFFSPQDYQEYLHLLQVWSTKEEVSILAYCLMPNHTHIIAVPKAKTGLAKCFGETHRRYSRMINFRNGWRGFLWQDRFHSCLLDQQHLLAAVRYVELNPVRARLTDNPFNYPWSSACAHLSGESPLVDMDPLRSMVEGSWQDFLRVHLPEEALTKIQLHTRTGRPLGEESFLHAIEEQIGRSVRPQKPGSKPKKFVQTPAPLLFSEIGGREKNNKQHRT